MSAPDCYACLYRGELPGDAHSSCVHPSMTFAHENPLAGLIALTGGLPPLPGVAKGDPHGIRMGWFSWPFNFDPTWLVECSGFKEADAAPRPTNVEKLIQRAVKEGMEEFRNASPGGEILATIAVEPTVVVPVDIIGVSIVDLVKRNDENE